MFYCIDDNFDLLPMVPRTSGRSFAPLRMGAVASSTVAGQKDNPPEEERVQTTESCARRYEGHLPPPASRLQKVHERYKYSKSVNVAAIIASFE